jgi:aspartate aminotransferase
MKLSHLAETLIGSEIVKLGGEIREKIRAGEKIYNFTVGDFDPAIFPIPKEQPTVIILPITLPATATSICARPSLTS